MFAELRRKLSLHKGPMGISFSCKIAWKLYTRFKQDFECLGYALPEICYTKECSEGFTVNHSEREKRKKKNMYI